MKYTISILALSLGLFLTACGSDDEGHSHGEDADHTHEQPAQQSTDDSDAVRIGGGEDSELEVRTAAGWEIRRRLLAIPGVA